MKHIFQAGKENQPIFILLHGTGGDENNLISLAQALNPEAGYLGIRGDVNEHGMNRFFKREAEGVYDVEDLNQRGSELYQFIEEASTKYEFDLEEAIYVGFSNGSNIAINMLLREGTKVNNGALFAPMYPVDLSDNTKDMNDVSVYLSMGRRDPVVPEADSLNVVNIFEQRGAHVETFWVNSHEVNAESVLKAREWLQHI